MKISIKIRCEARAMLELAQAYAKGPTESIEIAKKEEIFLNELMEFLECPNIIIDSLKDSKCFQRASVNNG
ncbi:MAG: hypothetical protein ACUVTN_00410 [Thermodesulfobacteriota bacterium]